jgi:ATP-dependent Clp protease ATP-binding subunit ClpC
MRSGMVRPNKPAGSFLFLGPTGVGKTEMAKALAEQYFGSENKIIRLDMSEFQGENALGRLIGSKKLKQEGALTTAAQNHPYALLLLDEIEKANSRVLDIFLQILDEGFVHDGFNRKINFSTMIIIATSNASSSLIKEMIEEGAQDEDIKKQVIDAIIKKGIFRPELLNRFDDVVMFHSLKKDDIPKIVKLMLVKFVKRMKTEQHIEVVFDEEVIQKIIENGFEPIFGARSLLRYIDDVVADALARKIITDKIRRGETIQFKKEDLDI